MEKRNVVSTPPSKTKTLDAFKDLKLEEQQTKGVKGGNGGDGDEDDGTTNIVQVEVVDL